MDWTEADEVIAFAEIYLTPVPEPLPAWQQRVIRHFFPDPAEP